MSLPKKLFSTDATYNFSFEKSYDGYGRFSSANINGIAVSVGYDGDDLVSSIGDLQIARSADAGLLTGTQLGSIQEGVTYSDFAEISSHSYTFNAMW